MKQKRMKSITVAVIAILIIGGAILSLNIEPADDPVDQQIQTGQLESDEQNNGNEDQYNEPVDGEEQAPVTEELPEEEQPPAVEQKPQTEQPSAVEQKPQTEQPPVEEAKVMKCTFEIRCDTLTDTSKVENPAILPYIPADGVVLATTEVEFEEGDTVFDALQKVTRDKGIQMEFRNDKLYTCGAYIEGINYLYEFDGGPLSGWMYKVNGWFPNYGCAGYTLKEGDEVVWLYTCDLGTDVGDNSTWE